jgi:hypothetical protein
MSGTERLKIDVARWQFWAGVLVCGACGFLGSYLGRMTDYPYLVAAVGGGIGGFLFGRINPKRRSTL